MKNRIKEIDFLRGIAAICMILGHTLTTHPSGDELAIGYIILEKIIVSFHMPLFFILAGYVWHYNNKGYFCYIKNKIYRILIPFLFFGLLLNICYSLPIANKYTIRGGVSIYHGLYNLIIGLGDFWFLYVIFEIYLIFPLFYKLNIWIKVLLFVVLTIIGCFKYTMIMHVNQFFFFMPYFVCGNLLKDLFGKNIKIKINSVLLCLICIINYLLLWNFQEYRMIRYVMAYDIIMILFIIVKCVLSSKKEYFDSLISLFCNCGIFSLQLYLFNHFIMTPMRYILYKYLYIYWLPARIVIQCCFAIALTLFICKYILAKNKKIAFLCGML